MALPLLLFPHSVLSSHLHCLYCIIVTITTMMPGHHSSSMRTLAIAIELELPVEATLTLKPGNWGFSAGILMMWLCMSSCM
jgi:hypothetical protein